MIRKDIIYPIVYMILIFILSSIPADTDKKMMGIYIEPNLQNILHIPLYGLLVILWRRFFSDKGMVLRTAVIYTLIISVSYGILDEVHQFFVPGRYMNLMDVLFNAIGCLVGVWFYRLKSLRVRRLAS